MDISYFLIKILVVNSVRTTARTVKSRSQRDSVYTWQLARPEKLTPLFTWVAEYLVNLGVVRDIGN